MYKKLLAAILALSALLSFGLTTALADITPEHPVFTEDFSDASSAGQWTHLGNPSGSIQINSGAMNLACSAAFSETVALYNQQKCKDFTVEFTYKFSAGTNNDAAMFLYRSDSNASSGYAVYFVHCPDSDKQYYIKFTSRPYTVLQEGLFFNNGGAGVEYNTQEVQVKMVVKGGVHTLYMTMPGQAYGAPVFTHTETTTTYDRSGFMGFMQWHDAGDSRNVSTMYDNFKITCEDEAEAVIPTEIPDTTPVTAGVISEDFSGSAPSDKWGFYRKEVGGNSARLVDGLLELNTLGGNVPGESAAYYKENFQNGTIEADVILSQGSAASIVFRGTDYMRNGYQLILDRYSGLKLCARPYELLKEESGFKAEIDREYHVKITVDGNKITAVVSWTDDQDVAKTATLEYTDAANLYPDPGYVGFVNYVPMGGYTQAYFDNLVITKVVASAGTNPPDDTQDNNTPDKKPADQKDETVPKTGNAFPVAALAASLVLTAVIVTSRRRRTA